MSFFDFILTENDQSFHFQDDLEFDDSHIDPESEIMFQNTYKKNVLLSRNLYQYATNDEIQMNEILLEDFFRYEKVPIFNVATNSPKQEKTPMALGHQTSSPFPSTMASSSDTPLQMVQTPKNLLQKRKALYDLESDFSVESDYIPEEEEEEFVVFSRKATPARSTQKSHHGSPQESLVSPKSGCSPQDSQNKMKNHQGSIAGKIKKECRRYQVNTKLFDEATSHLSEQKKEEFRKWASTYKKNQKTWNTLKDFLSSHKKFGAIFVDMINSFLSEDFKNEYEEWLNHSQMSIQTKALLKENESKEFYSSKFSLIIDEIQGRVDDFENEIKKSRKFLKVQ